MYPEGDDRCGGADCSDPQFASFHDFKETLDIHIYIYIYVSK